MGKIDRMKVPELEEELRKRNARISGRKQELIDRYVQLMGDIGGLLYVNNTKPSHSTLEKLGGLQ